MPSAPPGRERFHDAIRRYFRALKVGDASRVAPIDKLSVVLVAVLGVSVLGERLSLRDWTGIAMIAGGALLLAIKR